MLHTLAFSLIMAAASPANQVTLATKLAQAIANMDNNGGASKVYVGALPAGKAFSVPLPLNAILIGSVAVAQPANSSTFMFGIRDTAAFFELSGDTSQDLELYGRRIAQAGWRENAFMQRMEAYSSDRKGGFAVSPPAPPAYPKAFCNGTNTAILYIKRLPNMPNVVAVSSADGVAATAFCAMGAMAKSMPVPPSPPPMPTLSAVQGATLESNENAMAMPVSESQATLTTSLPLTSVAGNFASQITGAGWSADAPASSATAYVQTFRMTRGGQHYQMVLSIVSTGKPQNYTAALSETDIDNPNSTWGFMFGDGS